MSFDRGRPGVYESFIQLGGRDFKKMLRSDAINAALENAISPARLTKYMQAAGGSLDGALGLYEQNTKLSEAFYTPLQSLEVTLRNIVDQCMREAYGQNWLMACEAPLDRHSIEQVQLGMGALGTDAAHGAVVAEMKFSFWVGLLGPGYDASLWRRALHTGFRNGGGKRRSVVHQRLNSLRRFRNRIAHHEPIFERDLTATHDEILEAIGWMCPHTNAWTKSHSRLPEMVAYST